MIALAWGENGLRHITNSNRPINTPEDIKGLKLRLPQSDVMLIGFKMLGAETVSLPFPQVFGALQSGQIDGQEDAVPNDYLLQVCSGAEVPVVDRACLRSGGHSCLQGYLGRIFGRRTGDFV